MCNEVCEEKQVMCTGYKHRRRKCRKIGNEEIESSDVNCRDDGKQDVIKGSYERLHCAADCGEIFNIT